MSYHLFLDDVRLPEVVTWISLPNPESPWKIVRTYEDFVQTILNHGIPDFISFDHDLSYSQVRDYLSQVAMKGYNGVTIDYATMIEKTGMDCAKWLANYCFEKNLSLPKYAVHSMNHVGQQNIESYLSSFSKVSRPSAEIL